MSRNRATSAHLSRVAERGCALCLRLGLGPTPAEVHHVREGQGMAQRAPDWLAIGLCPEHHRGRTGLHGLGSGAFVRTYRCDELDLLADTLEAIYG